MLLSVVFAHILLVALVNPIGVFHNKGMDDCDCEEVPVKSTKKATTPLLSTSTPVPTTSTPVPTTSTPVPTTPTHAPTSYIRLTTATMIPIPTTTNDSAIV